VLGKHVSTNDFNVVGSYLLVYSLFWYTSFFGGVNSFRPDHFQLINGFSNRFYGWGGEDDDLLYR